MAADLKMDNTYRYLEEQEVILIEQMQAILTKYNRNASHRLYNSFEGTLKRTPKGFLFQVQYASHGKYVLDGKRNVKAKSPSPLAIQEIKKWILNKGISVGKGSIRTPLKKTSQMGGKYDLQPKTEAKQTQQDQQLTSFAYAIWYNIKKNRKTWAGSTDFLKPYNNLFKPMSPFKKGLIDNLLKDGFNTTISQYNEIKINIK